MNRADATTAPCLTDEFEPITEIAVPLAGQQRHESALTLANALAEHWGLGVHIVHVRLPADPVDNDRLEEVRAAFRARHPQTEVSSTLLAAATVPEAVASAVPSTALIVMSSEHADRSGSSSTAEAILRSTGGPALLVGPHADYEDVAKPVIVALDGSPTAEGALDCAVAFSAALGQRLELVQVIDPATSAHVARLRSGGQQVSESGHVRAVAERLIADGHNVGWEVVHDTDPIRGLLAVEHRMGAGVIVVGSHGDSGLVRRMLGSTAMGLVAESSAPVLVMATGGRDEIEITG